MSQAAAGDLIRVEGVSVSYSSRRQTVRAVNHASFAMREKEVVGILGESGSGKSTLALALARMLPAGARYEGGRIIYRGKNLLQMKEKELTAVRGAEIAIMWQDPALAEAD